MTPLYLDYQATTPCDPRVVEAMLPVFTQAFGNPHSDHALGREAAAAVEAARAELAALIGAAPREIVFTSGATEANNLAIKGAARHALRVGDLRRRIVTLATEHKCVLEAVRDLAGEGFEPVVLPVRADGLLDPAVLQEALSVPTLLVSIMAVNNETGVVQDLAALAPLVRAAGALLHSDCAQAAGRVALEAGWFDLASFSAHKMYGPKGIGALYVRHRPRVRLVPLFSGGGQERTLRSGTLPTPLVVGFGMAARIAREEGAAEERRLAGLRDDLLARLRARLPGLAVNGSLARRIGGNLNLCLPQAPGLPGVRALELMAAAPMLCLSTGSACSPASVAGSYVLAAMGLSPGASARSLRLALGRFTSPADIARAAALFCDAHDAVCRDPVSS